MTGTLDTRDTPTKPALARATRARRWGRRTLVVGIVLLVVYLFRVPILRALPLMLIASDPAPAEPAVVILEEPSYCDEVADLRREHPTCRVVLIRFPPGRLQKLGILPSDEAVVRRELARRGVPDDSMTVLPCDGFDDWDSARCLNDWLGQNPTVEGILLCDRFNSRLKRHVLDRVLDGPSARRIRVQTVAHPWYDESNWWQCKDGVMSFFHGSVALGYTWLYGPDVAQNPPWDPDQYERMLQP